MRYPKPTLNTKITLIAKTMTRMKKLARKKKDEEKEEEKTKMKKRA